MRDELKGITFHEKLGSPVGARGAHHGAGLPDRAARSMRAGATARRAGAAVQGRSRVGHGRRVPRAAGPDGPLLRRSRAHEARDRARDRGALQAEGADATRCRGGRGDAVAIAVALADKLDTLVGFWAIGEKPTGSGDPYQLRRAALGVIRIVLENDLRLPLIRRLRACICVTVVQACRRAARCNRRAAAEGLTATSSCDVAACTMLRTAIGLVRSSHDRRVTCSPSSPIA